MVQELLNYKIDRKIGEGGMGVVYLAYNPFLGQQVAIKMLHPKYAANPLLRDKFKQEAMLLSGLTHPNIVKFINYVENDDGVFLIMEYVEGITLDEYIHKKNGLIVEERAMPLLRNLADALHHAHVQGIVHRDIKPSNILIDKEGHIKILDFGIAKIMSEVQGDDIARGGGSPRYMSPEQVLGKHVDARSDIYSLGVVMYEILTGRTPYDSALEPMDIKHKVVHEPLPRMKDAYSYISDDAQKIVDRATRKNPAERFRNSGEMLQALRSGKLPSGGNAGNGGSNGGAIGGGASGASGASTMMGRANGTMIKSARSSNSQWWIWVIIALIVAAAAVAALMWWKPWDNQTARQKSEEQELLGDDDALLIDEDDAADDDDILLGANPTITLDAPADAGAGNKKIKKEKAIGKKSPKKEEVMPPAEPPTGKGPKKETPFHPLNDNGMKPEQSRQGLDPAVKGSSPNSGHDLKPHSKTKE